MKKIITLTSFLLAVLLLLTACANRRGNQEDTTLTPFIDEVSKAIAESRYGSSLIANVIYKEFEDHSEVVGCESPVGEVRIESEYNGKPVTVIADGAFQGMITISSVLIPESVRTIGKKAFMSCNTLSSVAMSDSVEAVDDYAFYSCSSLKDLELGGGVKTVGVNAFGLCSQLTAITVREGNTSFASDDGILFSADKTTLVAYPNAKAGDAYTIPESVKTVADFAFAYSSLKSVTMSNVEKLGDFAFRSCLSLENVGLGSKLTAIGSGSFQKCTSLVSVVIPEGVVSIGYKNGDAEYGASFCDCKALKTISLPSTLTNVYIRSFDGCKALETVNYAGSQSDFEKIVIGEQNQPLTDAKLETK